MKFSFCDLALITYAMHISLLNYVAGYKFFKIYSTVFTSWDDSSHE